MPEGVGLGREGAAREGGGKWEGGQRARGQFRGGGKREGGGTRPKRRAGKKGRPLRGAPLTVATQEGGRAGKRQERVKSIDEPKRKCRYQCGMAGYGPG